MVLLRNGKFVLKGNGFAFPPTAEPCDGVDCSGDPSMALTVTGASGTINWCGETWVLPGESGITKCVCPTFYIQGVLSYRHEHIWENYVSALDRLYQFRRITTALGNPQYKRNRLYVNNSKDARYWVYFSPTTVTFSSDLNLILTVPMPETTDYIITDPFFGEVTQGGITFKWERGNDWPP